MTITPPSDPKIFGYWAYLGIKKDFHKTIKYENDVLKDKDPEALHQMRVGMRRLRTIVTVFAPALSLPKAAQEKKIAKVARRLGELRDLDVLQDTLERNYFPELPTSEQKSIKKVLKNLHKQRQNALKQVQTTLSQQTYKELKEAFKNWLKQPSYADFAEFPIEDILPNLLLPTVSKLFLHPGWLVGVKSLSGEKHPSNLNCENVVELLETNPDVLHSLRKQAKRVRYQMELFTDFYEPSYQDYVQEIKEMQTILGQIQDSFILGEFLADSLESEITLQLPTLANQLQENRYQAWQKWQSLQQRYLNPQVKKELCEILLQPSAKA